LKINFYQTVGTHKNNLDSKWINNQVCCQKGVFSSLNIIWKFKSRKMRWVGHVTCVGEKNNACWVLVEKPKEKKSLRRSRHRWEDSIGGVFNGIGGY